MRPPRDDACTTINPSPQGLVRHGVAALESPFSSYRSVVRRKLDASRAARWLLRPWMPWLVTDTASPIEAIKNRPRCPLVILHGTADRVVMRASHASIHAGVLRTLDVRVLGRALQ
jgi:pimeloyl-ACP methyl ester carboxylesterase